MDRSSSSAGAGDVWAEMLASIADKNIRISNFMAREGRRQGRSLLRQIEQERSRIARDLHAGAGQPLAGIKLNLEILSACSALLPPDGQQAMVRLRQLTESALSEVRAVSHRLYPPDWQNLSTTQAIRRLLQDLGAETCFAQTDFDIRELPQEPGHSGKLALYRCAQECVSNVIRHSGATHLSVSLVPDGDQIELRVADNGSGIAADSVSGGGMGLAAIREHSLAAGGTCSMKSGVAGTLITVRIPHQEE
jgi:signal transduction histidine kinase